VLDRYVLAKTASLVEQVTTSMDAYDLYGACAAVTSFLDALNNWYIRRSRDRFWRPRDTEGGADADKLDAYDTLSTVLSTLCKVAAPLLPFLTESVYRGLTGETSVHLTDWPSVDELPADTGLVEKMDLVREICSAAHAIRKANGLRSRLPLRNLTVATASARSLEPFEELIRDEVNVKSVTYTDQVQGAAEQVLTLVPAVLGPLLGPDTQKVITAKKRGEWRAVEEGVEVAGVKLRAGDGGYELQLRPRDERSGRALPGGSGVVTLDLEIDDELESEGRARDLVRQVQSKRREAGLEVTDCITLEVAAPPEMASAIEAHRDYISQQTLAVSVLMSDTRSPDLSVSVTKTPCDAPDRADRP
jgi:isoleucyl-tRNA synthetase